MKYLLCPKSRCTLIIIYWNIWCDILRLKKHEEKIRKTCFQATRSAIAGHVTSLSIDKYLQAPRHINRHCLFIRGQFCQTKTYTFCFSLLLTDKIVYSCCHHFNSCGNTFVGNSCAIFAYHLVHRSIQKQNKSVLM